MMSGLAAKSNSHETCTVGYKRNEGNKDTTDCAVLFKSEMILIVQQKLP